MLVERVAQYPTAPVRNTGKIDQKLDFCFCSATEPSSTGPMPPAFCTHHHSSTNPPISSSGEPQLSRCLMPSSPRTIKNTYTPQKKKNAIQVCSSTPMNEADKFFHPGTIMPISTSIAPAPSQVWMPNHPQATTARSIAGMFAPTVPKLDRSSTGKLTPYLVPAWALRHMGISTIVLPSRMVIIACHHVMPASIIPPASVYVLITTLMPIHSAAMCQVFQVRWAMVVGARSLFQRGEAETSSLSSTKSGVL